MKKLLKEFWKPVNNYEGHYEVSNMGNIRSLDKHVNGGKGQKLKKGKLCKPSFRNNNYLFVGLSKSGKSTSKNIHRLVAKAFIPNPYNKPCVNHINGIKSDNRAENLEWCTYSENSIHAVRAGLMKPPQPTKGKFGDEHNRSKAVIQITLAGEFVKRYGSACLAAKVAGFIQTGISKCCNGQLKTHKGFIWKYEN